MKPLTRPIVWVVALTVALLAGFTPASPAQDKPKPPPPPKKPTVMERKLVFAQKVLEGLAKEDYAKISTNADGLIDCLKEVTWKLNDTEKYLLYSNDFLRRVENMKKAAKAKNIDAAALAYVDMTLTCVKCHQYLRDEGISSAPDLTPLAPKAVASK
jgi:hypothetical protein